MMRMNHKQNHTMTKEKNVMTQQNHCENDKQIESLADLELTVEQAEQSKAGRLGDEKFVYVFIGSPPN